MNESKRLVKIIKDKNGQEQLSCAVFGTDNCKINEVCGCSNCSYIWAMMNELYQFERIYYGSEYIEYTNENTE